MILRGKDIPASCQVCKISKQWRGLAREVFTNDDTFAVSFPADLDTKVGLKILQTFDNLESLVSGQGYTSWVSNLD